MATIIINVNTAAPGERSSVEGTITVTTEDPINPIKISTVSAPNNAVIRNVKVKVNLVSTITESYGGITQGPISNIEIKNIEFSSPSDEMTTEKRNKNGIFYSNNEEISIGSFKRANGIIHASKYFTASNKNTVTSFFYFSKIGLQISYNNAIGENETLKYGTVTIPTSQRPKIELELTAKPSFNVEVVSVAPYYTGLTPYIVNITNCSAKFGGDIERSTLQLNNNNFISEEISGSGDGRLSIDINPYSIYNDTETLTPNIRVIDSRGLIKTENLSSVEYIKYIRPEILSVNVFRCDTNGILDEDGEKAILCVDYKLYKNVATSIKKPEVIINGVIHSNDITWYENYNDITGLSNEITFPYTPNEEIGVIYGYVNVHLQVNNKFLFDTKIEDSIGGESDYYNSDLPSSEFTIDFLAGGKGIAFGKASTEEGFDCNMKSTFRKDVDVIGDLKLSLDTSDPPDLTTVDGRIYKALKDLGWDSEIIV